MTIKEGSMRKINFTIMGAGKVAVRLARTVSLMDTVEAYGIASRDASRAQSLADQFGFKKSYESYESMLEDPDVDLVYIATPHSHHARQIRMCLEAGKHVLCEKAFTVTAAEAADVLALARGKNLLLTEAMWPRYMPMVKTIKDFCASGRIGKIQTLTANIGYPVSHLERISDPKLAGGALLDVGVYALSFATLVMGRDIKDITTTVVMNELGADMQSNITLKYGDGRLASLFNSVLATSDLQGVLGGETGYAIIDNINNFESLRLYDDDNRLIEQIDRPIQLTGYEYEVQAAVDAIQNGQCECEAMTHDETLFLMTLMDQIRHSWGVWYPGEQKS
jgi:predicted dehydrogenase